MICVKNLHRTYGTITALHDVSFEIGHGEIVGFLGPNGAGKSTTMRILTGLLAPTSGQVWIAGVALNDPKVDFRSHIGYLPESAPLHLDMRVVPYLSYVASMRAIKPSERSAAIKNALARCGLDSVHNRRIGTLSKGFRQRVGLAQAIIHRPKILILDEPTSGLDPNQMLEIRTLIQELGAESTVLISSHILHEIQAVAQRVIVLNQGRVVADESLSAPTRNTLRVTVEASQVSTLIEQISTLPGVEQVTVDDRSDLETRFQQLTATHP